MAGTEIDYKLAISVPVTYRLQRLVRVARSGSGDRTLERVTPLNWGVRIERKGEARCAQCECRVSGDLNPAASNFFLNTDGFDRFDKLPKPDGRLNSHCIHLLYTSQKFKYIFRYST